MQVRKGKPPGSSRLARIGVELSREARVRLAWMDFYHRSRNVAHTCRHFGISRQTFYRWQRRFDAYDLTTLEARSHRPHRQRQPTWTFPLAEKFLTLRLQFPRWGKDKLAVLLRRQQLPVSTSMVGRILTQLKQQGRLVEPPRSGVP
jgi:putative transposase